ncbi:MAG: hypothetical protein R3A47_04365 [Polyangiales bacterium]
MAIIEAMMADATATTVSFTMGTESIVSAKIDQIPAIAWLNTHAVVNHAVKNAN